MALITRTQFIKKPADEVFAVVTDGKAGQALVTLASGRGGGAAYELTGDRLQRFSETAASDAAAPPRAASSRPTTER